MVRLAVLNERALGRNGFERLSKINIIIKLIYNLILRPTDNFYVRLTIFES